MENNITAEWARNNSKDYFDKQDKEALQKCLELIKKESKFPLNTNARLESYHLSDKVIENLKERGFNIVFHKGYQNANWRNIPPVYVISWKL